MSELHINLNDHIKIKVTERGKEIYKKYLTDLRLPESHIKDIQVDADGWSTFSLWEVMHIWGPYIYMGSPLVIETEMIIIQE